MVDLDQLDFAGRTLRAWNQEIKAALQEVGAAPGSMTQAEARALLDAQTNYDRLREAYTFVYRSIYGTVPDGLAGGGRRGSLGALMAPIALSNPATALVLIVAAIAAGGVAWQAMQVFRDAIEVWRQRVRMQGGFSPDEPFNIGEFVENNLIWIAGGALGLVLIMRR